MTGRGTLEIRLLGRFAVLRDGAEIPAANFGGRKVRALLRILATRRGSFVSNDVLTEALWPDRAPADPAANLQVLVNRARRALGDPDAIRTGPGGYTFIADGPHRVDAELFIAAVEASRSLAPADELRALGDALRLWGGEPLAEDAYAEWAAEYRAQLDRGYQSALERAATLALDLGEFDAAVEHAAVAAEREPLREAAVIALVQALAAAGDPAAALGRFDEYRRAIADELGIDPSAEAQAVQQRLLTGAAGARPSGAVTPPRATFGDLPFVGRQAEFEWLREVATRGGSEGCTIVVGGSSGAGKSRLLEVLARQTPTVVARAVQPERAVPWSLGRTLLREVVAQDVLRVDRLAAPLRTALGSLLPELDTPGTSADPESSRALGHEAALQLLDSIGTVVVVDDLQWADPTSLALIETARARLPGLRLVLAFRPDEVAEGSEVATLLTRIDPDTRIELAGLSASGIRELVADDGLARAIEATTDRTPLAVSEVLRALTADGLVGRSPDGRWSAADDRAVEAAEALGRQGQRRVIAARADRLPPEAREILGLVCLLAREAAVRTLSDAAGRNEASTLAALATLHRTGLVRAGELGWTTAHDMVGDAVAAQLQPAERARLHGQLAAALAAEDDAAGAARHWREAGDRARAATAFIAAARRALDTYADAETVALASAGLALDPASAVAADLREIRGEAYARIGEIARAREDLRAALAARHTGAGRSRLLARLARLTFGADDLVRAAELAELALVEAGQDDTARAQALEIASVVDMNLGRTERSAERSAAALELYQRLSDANGTARVMDARAMATFLDGEVRVGGEALRRTADLFEDSGDLIRVVTPRSTSGHALVFAGRADDGLAATTAALDIARALGHPEGQAYALWHRAEALAALGSSEEADADAHEALTIALRLGHRGWTATSWRAVGVAAQSRGDLDTALHAFEQSLAASEHLDLFACWAAARVALVLIVRGDIARATPLVERALDTGPPLGQFEARLAQVELAVATEDSRATRLARDALAAADAAGVVQGRARLAAIADEDAT